MKKILFFAFILSFLFLGGNTYSLDCDFRNITLSPCSTGETPIVSFERENGTTIFPFNATKYDYALCCKGISSKISFLNYGIIPRRDYWQNPTSGCSIYHNEHCNYPDIYNKNTNDFMCDRGIVNISLMYDRVPPITPHSLVGAYDDFYRPYTLCIPALEGRELKSYISVNEICYPGHIKLFVLSKKTNSLIYKDTIPSETETGYAVCIYNITDNIPPVITIISPQPIIYTKPNIDILISTNEKTKNCRFSLDGGDAEDMSSKNEFNTTWEASITDITLLGKYEMKIECEDMASNTGSSSVTFERIEYETLHFDETDINMHLGEKKIINIVVQNKYKNMVVFNINMTHDVAPDSLPLTNFGWFDGHRSDFSKTNLNLHLSPGQSQTVSYIQYGGLEGRGSLILNVKAS